MKGRIRNIKPELAKHWLLWQLGRVTGWPQLPLWYALLWCWTDRRERFVWNAQRLKSEIAPYDDVNFEHVLNVLANAGFILKYRIGARTYGWIPRFLHHQHINGREDDSVLPAPPAGPLLAHAEEQTLWASTTSFEGPESLLAGPRCFDEAISADSSDLGTREPHVPHVHPILSHPVEDGSLQEEGTSQDIKSGTRARGTHTLALRNSALPAVAAKLDSSALLGRLAAVFTEIAVQSRTRVSVDEVRRMKAEMVFLYWQARYDHPKSVIVKNDKRIAKIIARLKENDDDVSELLYALDGASHDRWIMGLDPKSEGKKYDGLETILRDRAQVERFASTRKKFRDGVPHKLIPELEAALRGDGTVNNQETIDG